ncbi:MAG: tRNA (cytosine(32)/uridine(32)-2'-O)-methyltransferase TrmJ [Coxiella sp. (in: Bacteria)]|nr:MAG: tRNA (cytosine(32)/uridine(32)-2'-O)-methyltransferase TrmJ [Coxiella sp. (in: g-proteobacteria)]
MSVRIILTCPSHPGNIGATARAMKNMGLSELYLVAPKDFPCHDATVRASGADDILEKAQCVDSLEDALAGCHKVFATSARSRRLEWPLCTPREAAEKIKSLGAHKSAIVFGRESSGLTNDELSLCHYHIHIPTIDEFSSLNLSQAVQVIVYELFVAISGETPVVIDDEDVLASADELHGLTEHLRQTMTAVQFLNPNQPRKLMLRLRRLFQRADTTKTEVNILRGFLTAIDQRID